MEFDQYSSNFNFRGTFMWFSDAPPGNIRVYGNGCPNRLESIWTWANSSALVATFFPSTIAIFWVKSTRHYKSWQIFKWLNWIKTLNVRGSYNANCERTFLSSNMWHRSIMFLKIGYSELCSSSAAFTRSVAYWKKYKLWSFFMQPTYLSKRGASLRCISM